MQCFTSWGNHYSTTETAVSKKKKKKASLTKKKKQNSWNRTVNYKKKDEFLLRKHGHFMFFQSCFLNTFFDIGKSFRGHPIDTHSKQQCPSGLLVKKKKKEIMFELPIFFLLHLIDLYLFQKTQLVALQWGHVSHSRPHCIATLLHTGLWKYRGLLVQNQAVPIRLSETQRMCSKLCYHSLSVKLWRSLLNRRHKVSLVRSYHIHTIDVLQKRDNVNVLQSHTRPEIQSNTSVSSVHVAAGVIEA